MTTNPAPQAPEDMSEIYDARIDRVDLVGAAANGHRFLIAKGTAGLVDADAIRQLLKDAGAEDADTAAAGLVMNADPVNPPTLTKERTPAMADSETTPDAAADVTKDAETAATETSPVEKTETPADPAPVVKADSMLAVFDRAGNLIGVIAPDALTPVDGGETPSGDDDGMEDVDESAVNATEADGANTVDGQDYGTDTGAQTIPGTDTDTVQSPVEKHGKKKGRKARTDVTKTADIGALLKEALAPLVEKIASNDADLASTVEVLKGRLDAMGREPDDRNSPLLNGGTGNEGVAKRAADQEDAFAPFEKAVSDAKASGDPTMIAKAEQRLQFARIRALYPNE